MALLAASTIEVRPGAGADTNGGGASNAAGTNLSLQDAAAYAVTDLVTNGTTTVTSATANWGTDVVANWMYITGGSGSVAANWYRVVTRNSASSLVLDRSTGLTAGTGATSNTGGALATIGGLGQLLAAGGVSGMVCWVKAGTDTLTSGTANVSGGRLSVTAGLQTLVIGYSSTRGDLNASIGSASRPLIDAGAITAITVMGHSGNRAIVANIRVDGNDNATVVGFSAFQTYNCTAQNCPTGFAGIANPPTWPVFCSAIACGVGFGDYMLPIFCFTNDCTTAGISATSSTPGMCVGCVSINDAIGWRGSANLAAVLVGNTFHEAAGDGINGAAISILINNLITSNTSDGIDWTSQDTANASILVKNATRANGTLYEFTPPSTNITGAVALSGDPYTAEASDDMSPNNTASAGASLRNAGVDVYGQTDNRDIGAVQHADPAGGGGGAPIIGLGTSIIRGAA